MSDHKLSGVRRGYVLRALEYAEDRSPSRYGLPMRTIQMRALPFMADAALNRFLMKMEADKLIEQRSQWSPGRRKIWFITPAGRSALCSGESA